MSHNLLSYAEGVVKRILERTHNPFIQIFIQSKFPRNLELRKWISHDTNRDRLRVKTSLKKYTKEEKKKNFSAENM